MSEKKKIVEVLSDFSEKLSAINKSKKYLVSNKENEGDETEDFIRQGSHLSNLQEQINEREDERMKELIKNMKDFFEPPTSDIEADEKNLLKAYELFCKIKEVTDKTQDKETYLKDFSISSPLCKKNEYTDNSNRFRFLRLWFLLTKPESNFIPQMQENNVLGTLSYSLVFTEKEMWKPSLFEKEVLQALSMPVPQ